MCTETLFVFFAIQNDLRISCKAFVDAVSNACRIDQFVGNAGNVADKYDLRFFCRSGHVSRIRFCRCYHSRLFGRRDSGYVLGFTQKSINKVGGKPSKRSCCVAYDGDLASAVHINI